MIEEYERAERDTAIAARRFAEGQRDDLAEAVRLARLIEKGPGLDAENRPDCQKCHVWINTPGDLEPTPLCNLCAQDAAELLATALLTATAHADAMEVARIADRAFSAGGATANADAIARILETALDAMRADEEQP